VIQLLLALLALQREALHGRQGEVPQRQQPAVEAGVPSKDAAALLALRSVVALARLGRSLLDLHAKGGIDTAAVLLAVVAKSRLLLG